MRVLLGTVALLVALLLSLTGCDTPPDDAQLMQWVDECGDISRSSEDDKRVRESCDPVFNYYNKGPQERKRVCDAVRNLVEEGRAWNWTARLFECHVPFEVPYRS